MSATLQLTTGSVRQTVIAPVKACKAPLRGQTATGYGKAMPMPYKVYFNMRWQRVKACCFSNVATCYIGNMFKDDTVILVQDIQE